MRTILILRKAARHEGGPGARQVATNAVQSSKASHLEGVETARSRNHDIPSFFSNLLGISETKRRTNHEIG